MYVTLRFFAISILVLESLGMIVPGGGRGPCPGCPIDATADDLDVIKAARYAVGQLDVGLISIRRVQTQVVAGTNYHLWLTVLSKYGFAKNCRVTVWHKLDGTMELTDRNC